MSYKFINGYDSFSLKFTDAAGTATTYSFRLRYMALTEYYIENIIEHRNYKGDYTQEFISVEHKFDIDYSALIELEDTKVFIDLLNKRRQIGSKLELTPHHDKQSRSFEVVTDGNQYQLGRHYGGTNAAGDKDFFITLKTKTQTSDIKIADPNVTDVCACISCEEY